MSLKPTHEIHTRRFGRNLGLGLCLTALLVVIFGLTVVKVTRGDYEPPRGAAATAPATEARG